MCETFHGIGILPPGPTFDSKTGVQVLCQEKNVCSKISENSIYLMQNLRIGDRDCLTFFNSGAHLINRSISRERKISSNSAALGVIGGGSVMAEYGNFRFNLGPGEDNIYHEITAVWMRNILAGFIKYDLEEIGQEFRKPY